MRILVEGKRIDELIGECSACGTVFVVTTEELMYRLSSGNEHSCPMCRKGVDMHELDSSEGRSICQQHWGTDTPRPLPPENY